MCGTAKRGGLCESSAQIQRPGWYLGVAGSRSGRSAFATSEPRPPSAPRHVCRRARAWLCSRRRSYCFGASATFSSGPRRHGPRVPQRGDRRFCVYSVRRVTSATSWPLASKARHTRAARRGRARRRRGGSSSSRQLFRQGHLWAFPWFRELCRPAVPPPCLLRALRALCRCLAVATGGLQRLTDVACTRTGGDFGRRRGGGGLVGG